MTAKRSRPTVRMGRPPGGARPGEKLNEYPQLSVRVPPEVKVTLAAISTVQRKTQWRIIIRAIDLYMAQLSPTEQRAVRKIVESAVHHPPSR
jgi:hypothetical protein